MIIKIEDAPNIKNIKIDINFDDDTNTVLVSSENSDISNKDTRVKINDTNKVDDILLNTEESYSDNIEELEKVEKPEIPNIDRQVKVSDDMINADF